MEDDLDAVYIALEKLRLERAALLAERRHLLQERGGGLMSIVRLNLESQATAESVQQFVDSEAGPLFAGAVPNLGTVPAEGEHDERRSRQGTRGS
jgi:hypothetical protein